MAAVVEIWRYPVKSMAGERLESCMVTQHGLEGDRRWAFVDGAAHGAREAGMAVDHRRFRANLYLEGIEPDEEIGWVGRRIRAGDAELEVVSRCVRCVVITKDPDTTAAAPELLDLLVDRHDKCMGVYCRVVKAGRVAVGDFVGV